jgi:hypothetical protein
MTAYVMCTCMRIQARMYSLHILVRAHSRTLSLPAAIINARTSAVNFSGSSTYVNKEIQIHKYKNNLVNLLA